MAISIGELEGVIKLKDELTPALKAAVLGIGGAGLAFTGLVGSIGLAAHSMMEMSERFENLSERTGIGVEALQKFDAVGATVGIGVEAMAMSYTKFSKSLDAGSEQTVASLARLGLTMGELKSQSPEKQMETLLTHISAMPNPTERTAVAMQLLGRAGAALVPVGANFAELSKRAEELGFIMSAQSVKAADDLGDALVYLEKTMGGVVNNIGSTVTSSTSLKNAVDVASDAVAILSKFIHENQATITAWIDAGINRAADAAADLANFLIDVYDEMGGLTGIVETATDYWNGFAAVLSIVWDVVLTVLGGVSEAISEVTLGFIDFGAAAQNMSTIFDALKLTWLSLKFAVVELGIAALEAKKFLMFDGDPMKVEIQKDIDSLKGLQAAYSDTGNDIVNETGKQKESTTAVKDAHSWVEKMRAKVKEHGDASKDAADKTKKLGTEVGITAEQAKKLAADLKLVKDGIDKWKDANTEVGILHERMNQVKIVVGGLGDVTKATTNEVGRAITQLNSMGKEGHDAAEKIKQGFEDANNGVQLLSTRIIGMNTLLKNADIGQSALKTYADVQAEVREQAGAIAEATQAQSVRQHVLNDMLVSGSISLDQYTKLGGLATEEMDAQAKACEQAEKEYAKLVAKVEKFSIVMSTASDVLKGLGVSAESNLGKLVDSMSRAASAGAEVGKGFAALQLAQAEGKPTMQAYAQMAVGVANGLGEIIHAATSSTDAIKNMMSATAAGASAGAAFGAQGAAIGAAFGAEFSLGASGEIQKHVGTIGSVLAGILVPAVGLGEIFHSVFGNAADDADKAARAQLRLNAQISIATQEMNDHKSAVDQVKEAMDRYGIKVEEMGPKWAQQQLDEKAIGLMQDYTLLSHAAGDHVDVLAKMGPAFSDYLNTSIRAGTEIPSNMKPALEQMLKMGVLTDDAGNKMNSLDGVSFSQTIPEAMAVAVDAIKQLIAALDRIPRHITTEHETIEISKLVHEDGPNKGQAYNVSEDDPRINPNETGPHSKLHENASGFNDIVSSPTMHLFGEKGPERVSITPLGKGAASESSSAAALDRGLSALRDDIRSLPNQFALSVRDELLKARVG